MKIVGGNAVEPDGLGVEVPVGAGGMDGGAQALMAKVAEITGEDVLEEDDVVGPQDPDDEEVA